MPLISVRLPIHAPQGEYSLGDRADQVGHGLPSFFWNLGHAPGGEGESVMKQIVAVRIRFRSLCIGEHLQEKRWIVELACQEADHFFPAWIPYFFIDPLAYISFAA